MSELTCRYCAQPIRRNRSSTSGWVHVASKRKRCAEPWQLVPDTSATPAREEGP
jgi:hypothetical protein